MPDGIRAAWVEDNREQLSAAAASLLAAAIRYGVTDRDWLDELELDHASDTLTPASIAVMDRGEQPFLQHGPGSVQVPEVQTQHHHGEVRQIRHRTNAVRRARHR